MSSTPSRVHPAWLPPEALAPLTSGTAAVVGDGPCLDTARRELAGARPAPAREADVVVATGDACADDLGLAELPAPPPRGAVTVRTGGRLVVVGHDGAAALRGLYAAARTAARARLAGRSTPDGVSVDAPEQPRRMLDHWDNMEVHPVMGQVERGYAGGSLFFEAGRVRDDLARVHEYARLLASIGIDAVAVNNVNVHEREAHLLTDDLTDVARLADVFRAYGMVTYLSVSFGSPRLLGHLATNDPLDEDVRAWWRQATDRVYATIPDFGGYVVKADSEGQPGPFAYGRTHADGANLLAEALRPHGGTVVWRAFVYDHRQDWRDRSTDRARAAHDHFAPLDGRFADNVVLQVKHGPMDFQVREPVSPVIAAMPRTRVAVELQVTQEYTGQQRHVAYLAPAWREYLGFRLDGEHTVAELAAGETSSDRPQPTGGLAAVSNVGTDAFWTGHPLAQANLYAFGRLAWDSSLTAEEILDEWVALTFAGADDAALTRIAAALHAMMDDSLARYEAYTAPLGIGFMVTPGVHYGPSVEGYEYSPWGTYHFADRDGIGVDRTVATGTGYTGQYPSPWRETYESLETCPDELLLFFHHVPYAHVLHSGSTVVQHVYDSRADAVEQLDDVEGAWASLADLVGTAVPEAYDARVRERLAEQRRSAVEWRDQLRTYFHRASGIPDATGRAIY
ncbi:MAG: alpha-glucuronidase [Micrococcales bacterium 73-15]|uniref:alpha-glucuronidase n=1 Tax=Salana multivorans TaxID=120377 RepID=UPI00095AF725|nr:alpha-glucuronidase [Salana multivorans]OJX96128.1 MAG: alpha-glucuronidase [Micrococcales bacterium 73-15]